MQKLQTSRISRIAQCIALGGMAFALTACSTWDGMSKRERSAVGGAAVGGVAGAAVTGGGVLGTVGGAAIGGVVGDQIGKDR
ncbi:glycine zipper 2TM domain-containing protein [Corticibacter populi]|uniref:Glycine zipper 2TM domain-containing protein n=2 Tax=Corticibacter populi TaxID=1550736 RepID=A0A3M6QYU7_9BURK|nr:glycine zipper 2TM domain-containing protein [Corticibacter populi]RMX07789.1 glycine zipper 2TM domain-containing protein [Corticibacter populi]RZS35014.1 osmotically inducible lipoprotein OsmB [Corticibacter populi]